MFSTEHCIEYASGWLWNKKIKKIYIYFNLSMAPRWESDMLLAPRYNWRAQWKFERPSRLVNATGQSNLQRYESRSDDLPRIRIYCRNYDLILHTVSLVFFHRTQYVSHRWTGYRWSDIYLFPSLQNLPSTIWDKFPERPSIHNISSEE